MTKQRRTVLLVILIIASVKGYAQNLHLDSMSNLYIITLDKTGSMLWNEHQKYDYSRITSLATNVTERLKKSKLFDAANFKKDRFLFFYSGIIAHSRDEGMNLPQQIKYTGDFENSLIHHTDGLLNVFNGKDDLVANMFNRIDTGKYNFEYSFVSQLRLFSLIKGIDYIKEKQLTSSFNHIYLLMVTDDEDQNDLWMKDYKTIHKYAPTKIREVNLSSGKYLFNPFNELADSTKSGVFYNRYSDEDDSPYLNFYEYRTSQQSSKFSVNDRQLVKITLDGRDSVHITVNRKEFGKDQISFFHIDSLFVNGVGKTINTDLNNTLSVYSRLKGGINFNELKVTGYFQLRYKDTLLGERSKIIKFKEFQKLPSAFLVDTIYAVIFLAGLIFMITMVNFFLICPNKDLFVIYDSLGNKFRIKRGKVISGGTSKWKQGDNALLYYFIEKKEVFFLKRKNRNIKQQQTPFVNNSFAIVIKSSTALYVDNTYEHFKPNTDIPEYHEGRNFNSLLESVYKKSIKYRLLHRLNSAKKIKRAYRRIIGKYLIKLTGRHYYLIQLDYIDTTNISISAKNYLNKTFTVEIGTANKITKITENERFIKMSVKDHYFSNAGYADGLIVVNCLPDMVIWNILKLEYRSRLSHVYQLLEYEQRVKKPNDISVKDIEDNIVFLRKHMLKSTIPLKKTCVYFNISPGVQECFKLPDTWHSIVFSPDSALPDLYFKVSTYPRFLYLSQTKDIKGKEIKMLYSPFLNGNDLETMTQSPVSGNFHLYDTLTPELIERPGNPYINQLSHNVFTFSSMKDMVLKIDKENNEITYDDQIINLNENQI